MNYQKIYNSLIESRRHLDRKKSKEHYFERHHIVPVSLGGSDDKSNLVLLTAREHFIAHHLLYKIHECKGPMLTAFHLYDSHSRQ